MQAFSLLYIILKFSIFLVNGVATVAGHMAEKMAPHVKKHGSKLVPESLKKKKDGQASKLDGAKFVAANSLQGKYKYRKCEGRVHTIIYRCGFC